MHPQVLLDGASFEVMVAIREQAAAECDLKVLGRKTSTLKQLFPAAKFSALAASNPMKVNPRARFSPHARPCWRTSSHSAELQLAADAECQ